jgi:hypothetical protein
MITSCCRWAMTMNYPMKVTKENVSPQYYIYIWNLSFQLFSLLY